MEAIDLDSFDDIKDISYDISKKPSNISNKPNLITRDPPSRSPVPDSSFGLDLIMNKEKQRKRGSPRASPSSFSPVTVEEPKSSFSNNMFSKLDNSTPKFNNIDSYLSDDMEDLTSAMGSSNITKVDAPSPIIELKPPSGGGGGLSFNFDDDLMTDSKPSNNFSNGGGNNYGGNNYGGNHDDDGGYQQPQQGFNSYQQDKPMSVEDMQKKKFDLLCKLERLKRKGVVIPRTYTMNSSYDEIKYEYDRLHNERLMDNSVKMYRQMLVSVTTGIEYLNNKVNPFDVYLDGWSDQVYTQQHDYDEVFEEIYEKYKDKGSMPPELRLLLSLGGSALMYHLSNTMFKSVLPGAQDILRQNPDLMKHMQQTLLNTMAQQGPTEAAFAGMMGGAMNQNGGYDPTSGGPSAGPRMAPPPSNMQGGRRQMSGPDGLDTFLDDINSPKNVNL
jgi:hypothetical protein